MNDGQHQVMCSVFCSSLAVIGHFRVPFQVVPLFQRKPKCENTLIGIKMKLHFHMRGFALGLVLKQRHKRLGDSLFEAFKVISFFKKIRLLVFFVLNLDSFRA